MTDKSGIPTVNSNHNPLRKEGFLRAISGGVIALLGLVCLLHVPLLPESVRQTEGLLNLVFGIMILALGLAAATRGLMSALRFDKIRFLPSDLAVPSGGRYNPSIVYNAEEIRSLLLLHRIPQLPIPGTLIGRVLSAVCPDLVFLIPETTYAIRRMMEAASGALVGLLCFGLGWFCLEVGIAPQPRMSYLHWLAVGVLAYQLAQWLGPGKAPAPRSMSAAPSSSRIAMMFGIAASLPVLLIVLPPPWVQWDTQLPIDGLFPLAAGLAMVCVGLGILLVRARTEGQSSPSYVASQSSRQWQQALHPAELFIYFRERIMGCFSPTGLQRYRLYTGDNLDVTKKNASFDETNLAETEPEIVSWDSSSFLHNRKMLASLVGYGLTVAAALVLVMGLMEEGNLGAEAVIEDFGSFSLVLWIFGSRLADFSRLFWAEVHFESYLAYLKCEGTVAESRITAGNSIYDTLRSDNKLVRSSVTARMACARIVTATLAHSGKDPLNGPRYVLSMKADDPKLRVVEGEMQKFFETRSNVVGIASADVEAINTIQQANATARRELHVRETDALPRRDENR